MADNREQRILRALIVDPGDRDGGRRDLVVANHAAFAARPIEWATPEDARIYALVRAHLDAHGEPPDITAVYAVIRGQPNCGDLIDRLERILMVREFAVRSSFVVLLEELHDARRAAATVELAKQVVEIVRQGLEVGEGRDARRLRGAGDALDHVIAEATRLRATAPTQSIFERASSVTEEDQLWLWNGYIALGELTLFEGPQGVGKSTVLSWLAASVTTGRALPGEIDGCSPGHVIWISTEEKSSTQIVPRLRLAGADLNRVHLLRLDRSWSTTQMRELESLVDAHDVRLIVVDAFKDVLGRHDENKDAEARRALRPLVELAHRRSTAVVGVRHWRKATGYARDRGGGSVGYGAMARGILAVAPHEDEQCLAVAKCAGVARGRSASRLSPIPVVDRPSLGSTGSARGPT